MNASQIDHVLLNVVICSSVTLPSSNKGPPLKEAFKLSCVIATVYFNLIKYVISFEIK